MKQTATKEQKSARPNSAVLLQLFVLLFSSLKIFNFINFIEVLRACRATSIETHVSSPHGARSVSGQTLGVARNVGVSAPKDGEDRGVTA